jgi:hypothetical protein
VVASVDIIGFLSGLGLGILLGVVLGPVARFWLWWHEWLDASREARLTEEVMERMDAATRRPGKRAWHVPMSHAGQRPGPP